MAPDGIAARVERSGGRVVVRDLEVSEDLRMAFGERRCLAAFRDFLADVERGAEEVRFEGVRGGRRMLLARHGYVPDRGAMVGPGGGVETAGRRLDAATFDSMPGSSFPSDVRVRMLDGVMRPVGALEAGDVIAEGGLVEAVMRGRMRELVDLGFVRCGAGSGVFVGGRWIRAREHPRAVPVDVPDGVEGCMIASENRFLEVEGGLFSDFHETAGRRAELAEFSERALEAMNAEERRERAGWSARPWRSGEIGLVRSWWRALREAGYGDWGDGPSVDEIGSEGFLAELDGKPVACAFLHVLPGAGYAAVCAPVCDPAAPPQACLRGIALVAEAAAEHCRRLGAWETVCHVRTPTIAKGFEMAGWRDGGPNCCHVYLCDETIPWLEP